MKQQAIDILDEMIHWIELLKVENITAKAIMEIKKDALQLARCNIMALWDGWKVPTITIPEWTVLLGKDEYEALKEKAWRYDDLSNS